MHVFMQVGDYCGMDTDAKMTSQKKEANTSCGNNDIGLLQSM